MDATRTRPSVLVVDDDLSLRVLATIVLSRGGYSPVAVSNGFRALDRLGRDAFDLVLTDLHMPGLDGFAVLGVLRTIRGAPPAVAMTGSADDDTLQHALALGAHSIVRKPFDAETLVAALDAALAAQPLAA